MRGFSIDEELVQVIQDLYGNARIAVLLNGQKGDFFWTSAGICHGCLLSPVLFNLFVERIMQETLHGHYTSISIGGRPISNLRFADDIDLMGGTSSELHDLTNRLYEGAGAYGMEVSTEKSKIMM